MKSNNPASYAQSVQVKYVPNDGSTVPNDFPLGTGAPLVRILLIVCLHVHDMQAYHLMYAISVAYVCLYKKYFNNSTIMSQTNAKGV